MLNCVDQTLLYSDMWNLWRKTFIKGLETLQKQTVYIQHYVHKKNAWNIVHAL